MPKDPTPCLTRHRDGTYTLRSVTRVARGHEQVFAFFSDAFNLERMTPPWVRFKVITPPPITMRQGLLIDYLLRIHGIPMRWQSEITEWDPPHAFTDVQRRGPYRLWHHRHHFAAEGDGTRVTDEVQYGVPGGRIIHDMFVRRDVLSIFSYRTQALRAAMGLEPYDHTDTSRG